MRGIAMILVLSGTKDGSKIISLLKKNGCEVVASATTEYGAGLAKRAGADEVIARALDYSGMVETLRRKKVLALIDATHPFAAEASRNAIKAAKSAGVKYLRFERKWSRLPKSQSIHYAKNFSEAAKKAAKLGDTIFFAAGSRNLRVFLESITTKKRVVARILPDLRSLEKCFELGLAPSDIIAAQGPFSYALNKAMLKEFKADVAVTKESGAVGGVESKVKAALALKIPVVVVKRPEIEYPAMVHSYGEVAKWVKKFCRSVK